MNNYNYGKLSGMTYLNWFDPSFKTNKYDDVIVYESGINDTACEKARKAFDNLPKMAVEGFIEEGGKICITRSLPGGALAATDLSSYKEAVVIYISEDNMRESLMHEIGRYIYYRFTETEDITRFMSIQRREEAEMLGAYSIFTLLDTEGYFAECFKTVYILKGIDYEHAAPMTFTFMNEVIDFLNYKPMQNIG